MAKVKLDDMEGEIAANIKTLSDAQEDFKLTRVQKSAATDMHEEFEASLSEAQKDEIKPAADLEALAGANKELIAVAKEKLDDMEGDHDETSRAPILWHWHRQKWQQRCRGCLRWSNEDAVFCGMGCGKMG